MPRVGCKSSSHSDNIVELNDDTQCKRSYQCCGYKANVPHAFAFNYPFQLLLAFTFSENALFSDSCSGTVKVSGEACAACQMLPHTKAVQQIVSRAHEADTHVNHLLSNVQSAT